MLTFALFYLLYSSGYAMVSAAHPDLQVLVSLSRVARLLSLCSTAEAAVIPLVASAP